jgi:hypothetical protein
LIVTERLTNWKPFRRERERSALLTTDGLGSLDRWKVPMQAEVNDLANSPTCMRQFVSPWIVAGGITAVVGALK